MSDAPGVERVEIEPLPPLDITADVKLHAYREVIAPRRGLGDHNLALDLARELYVRERQLRAALAQVRELRLALSLTCELHGCASQSCTAAQYHEDAQKMIADLTAQDAELQRLRERLESAEKESERYLTQAHFAEANAVYWQRKFEGKPSER